MTEVVPAFIDPPGPCAPTQEWRDYRDELRRSDLPGLGPFIREAAANIARLRRATGELPRQKGQRSATRRPGRHKKRPGSKTGQKEPTPPMTAFSSPAR
jgi:hypothetical protein